MRFATLVETSASVAAAPGKLDKIGRLADFLSTLEDRELIPAVAFLSGRMTQGRVGLGYAAIAGASDVAAATEPTLSIADVDDRFSALASMSGAGSGRERAAALRDLFVRATALEQDFLRRLMHGELRQGALEGVLVDAVARAANVPAASVRRAAMMAGDLGPVARAALREGTRALDAFAIQLMVPVRPMLADSAGDVETAMASLGDASLEYKLDGARMQIHKHGDDIRVFSRTLKNITAAVPEIVTAARTLPVRAAIFDGEAIALTVEGRPHPFQTTMKRVGRTRGVEQARIELPLTPFLFDCLYLDGTALIDEPQERRVRALRDIAAALAVPAILRPTVEEARGFAAEALARGHEGVMAKALDAAYSAGRRGSAWLKVKQARTLDLVVLAAEWGHGRRKGWLSNLHLGARDPDSNGFVMLGKTFKGLTDEMLAWQTTKFLALEIDRDAYTVHLRPELVVEVAFNEIQQSPVYPGGLALRFARVVRYREDKPASSADTIATVRAMAAVR
jgi:DNA ligase-1